MTTVTPPTVRVFKLDAVAKRTTETAYEHWYQSATDELVYVCRERIAEGNSIRAGRITAYQLTDCIPQDAVRKDTK